MATLTNNQINEKLAFENPFLSENKVWSKNSQFQFKIEESIEELLQNIKTSENWEYSEEKDGTMWLKDFDFSSWAIAWMEGEKLYLRTAWSGFKYTFEPAEDGSLVTFEGPLNALGRQNLLPSFTYVPGTLEGKYEDMSDFVGISAYCEERKLRHEGNKNPQDVYGAGVNRIFNNEIPGLPLWENRE